MTNLSIILNTFACLINPSVCNQSPIPSPRLHCPAQALTLQSESLTTPSRYHPRFVWALPAHARPSPQGHALLILLRRLNTVHGPSACKDILLSHSGSGPLPVHHLCRQPPHFPWALVTHARLLLWIDSLLLLILFGLIYPDARSPLPTPFGSDSPLWVMPPVWVNSLPTLSFDAHSSLPFCRDSVLSPLGLHKPHSTTPV